MSEHNLDRFSLLPTWRFCHASVCRCQALQTRQMRQRLDMSIKAFELWRYVDICHYMYWFWIDGWMTHNIWNSRFVEAQFLNQSSTKFPASQTFLLVGDLVLSRYTGRKLKILRYYLLYRMCYWDLFGSSCCCICSSFSGWRRRIHGGVKGWG